MFKVTLILRSVCTRISLLLSVMWSHAPSVALVSCIVFIPCLEKLCYIDGLGWNISSWQPVVEGGANVKVQVPRLSAPCWHFTHHPGSSGVINLYPNFSGDTGHETHCHRGSLLPSGPEYQTAMFLHVICIFYSQVQNSVRS